MAKKLGNHPKPKNQGGASGVYEQPTRTSSAPGRTAAFPASGSTNKNTSTTKPGSGSGGTGVWGKASFGKGKK